MKLRDLEPHFLTIESERVDKYTDDISKADGIIFLCPKCFAANGGSVGTHSIICWFTGRNIPPEKSPGPGRWNAQGTGYDDLTFVGPGAVSVLLTGGCGWHGFIRNGEATLE